MEKRELGDMIETFDEEAKARTEELKHAFNALREEIKNEKMEEMETMKHDLIKKIEDLDKDFEINFNRYVNETENRSKRYNEKNEKNKDDTTRINNYLKKIA
jgi:succinylglutamate desuccinylase